MKRLSACTLALCAALSHQLQAQRSELLLEKGWRFTRQDQASFSTPDYNDSKWSRVTVPHDWAGPLALRTTSSIWLSHRMVRRKLWSMLVVPVAFPS